MNKLFLDQGGYIELLKNIRRLYETTNKEFADTNTTYTLSLEGNNLKLTPSDEGPAQVLDLSTLLGNMGGGNVDSNVIYGGSFSLLNDTQNSIEGAGEGTAGYGVFSYTIPADGNIKIMSITFGDALGGEDDPRSSYKWGDSDLDPFKFSSLNADNERKIIQIETLPDENNPIPSKDIYVRYTYKKLN